MGTSSFRSQPPRLPASSQTDSHSILNQSPTKVSLHTNRQDEVCIHDRRWRIRLHCCRPARESAILWSNLHHQHAWSCSIPWCYWICWFRCFFDHQRCWICCLIHRILHHLWHQQPLFCWRKRLKLPCFCWIQHLLCCLISCLRCNCHRRNLHLFRWWCSSNRHGRYGWSCRSRRPRPINQPTNLISPCAYDRFPTRVCCIIRKEKGTGKHLGGDV